MNGVHDLGGMHGFGAVTTEANEPVFHHDWERRTFALALATMGARLANVDEFRRMIERMPPAYYLESSYYEHWLFALEGLLLEKGIITAAELDAAMRGDTQPFRQPSRPVSGDARDDDQLWSDPDAGATSPSGAVKLRRDPKFKPRFQIGDRVKARNFNPPGHTRTPRYVRGHHGVIRHDWGTFVLPDAHAHGLTAKPQHCYSVEFKARELWGKDFPAREVINVDLWEGYLEPDQSASTVLPRVRPKHRVAPGRSSNAKLSKRLRRAAPSQPRARASIKPARKKR
jgi:nitrile hydratase